MDSRRALYPKGDGFAYTLKSTYLQGVVTMSAPNNKPYQPKQPNQQDSYKPNPKQPNQSQKPRKNADPKQQNQNQDSSKNPYKY